MVNAPEGLNWGVLFDWGCDFENDFFAEDIWKVLFYAEIFSNFQKK